MSQTNPSIEVFMNQLLGDMSAAANGALVLLGDRLGLYRALAKEGPADSVELARRSATSERYVREWLAAQAASGYLLYDAESGRYSLSEAQSLALADEGGPLFSAGAFEAIAAIWRDEPTLAEAFRSGEGVAWQDHHPCLFRGTERFFRPAYLRHLLADWIPALDGVQQRLERGALVADVGCGRGFSTLLLARAFPQSSFVGFDVHAPSVDHAQKCAQEAGLAGRVHFERASAKEFPGQGYDLIACFDCLHDMGDPSGAARHIRQALAADGTWLVVEPFAHDDLVENLKPERNPASRLFYAFSTMVCTPASRSQEVGACLGAQAGERRLREVMAAGGFSRVRRATETPLQLVLEARP